MERSGGDGGERKKERKKWRNATQKREKWSASWAKWDTVKWLQARKSQVHFASHILDTVRWLQVGAMLENHISFRRSFNERGTVPQLLLLLLECVYFCTNAREDRYFTCAADASR